MASTAPETTASPKAAPFEIIGGHAGLARLVDRFYDLVENDPAYAELRAMHAPDLGPIRGALAGFLAGWMGGPRDWFDANPGKCMMSVHSKFAIDQKSARQWMAAMSRAIAAEDLDAGFAVALNEAFARMAAGMVNRP